ncbi:MAG: hypothetical protein KGL94_01995 [Acidobacteriota bacterium]|nr:hypothetical protein [Acidobacteriota bacterium]
MQAAVVLASRPPSRSGRLRLVGIAIPAAALLVGVVLIRTTSADAFAWAGAVATPLLAAAGRRRLPLAAVLWLVAWKADGLVAQGASVALIALAALTIARLVARVAPAWSIALGLVVVAAVDVVLVWGTHDVQSASTALHAASLPSVPRLQDATFGSATMGWLDLVAPALLGTVAQARVRAAAATGIAAGAWGLLLTVTSTVPATVPIVAGLALSGADLGHLRRAREPGRSRGGDHGDRRRPA